MKPIEQLYKSLQIIETKLGYKFKDSSWLMLAFVHRSFINEQKDMREHNERLEFLGDSVLGLLMADYLFRSSPEAAEGELSYLRSRLVEAAACASYAEALEIEQYVLLGKGERMNDGRGRDSILADLFEAIVGAIYLDGGIHAAKAFVLERISEQIQDTLKAPLRNWKALLQDYCQKKYQQPPVYHLLTESGPDHSKCFHVSVKLGQETLGEGEGLSKKEAQQAAAADALQKLGLTEIKK